MRSTVLALGVALLGLGGTAQAATISQVSYSEGHELVVESGAAVENFYTYIDGSYNVFGRDSTGAQLAAGSGCQADTSTTPEQVRCIHIGTLKRLRFDGGAGNDVMSFGGLTIPLVGTGGAGDDGIGNSSKPSNIDGGPGLDYIDLGRGGGVINGGDGDDYIDVTKDTENADDIRGGAGNDGANYGNYPAGVTVTLDDRADDGGSATKQNVHSDIEYVSGTRFTDRLVGNGGNNDLYGRDGNDTLIGGGGADNAYGEGGDDVIDIADDIAEKAECGPGNDEVIHDAVDTVVDCEKRTLRATDADGDGDYHPLDCDDRNPAFHHKATDVPGNKIDEDCSGADAPLVDLDRDGATNDRDCKDTDSSVHPGARDIPKDGIDQDCDGADDDYPRVIANIFVRTIPGPRSRIARLALQNVPANARVDVRCSGGGCPFARKVFRARRGRLTLTSRFRRSLSPGAVLQVRVTAPSSIAAVARITIRRNRAPKREDLCLRPGARRLTQC